jgi:hypothetical protein
VLSKAPCEILFSILRAPSPGITKQAPPSAEALQREPGEELLRQNLRDRYRQALEMEPLSLGKRGGTASLSATPREVDRRLWKWSISVYMGT